MRTGTRPRPRAPRTTSRPLCGIFAMQRPLGDCLRAASALSNSVHHRRRLLFCVDFCFVVLLHSRDDRSGLHAGPLTLSSLNSLGSLQLFPDHCRLMYHRRLKRFWFDCLALCPAHAHGPTHLQHACRACACLFSLAHLLSPRSCYSQSHASVTVSVILYTRGHRLLTAHPRNAALSRYPAGQVWRSQRRASPQFCNFCKCGYNHDDYRPSHPAR